ncbi:MAG: phage tail sheath family protein, partial [Acidobacteria bacterium]
MPQYLSPGVYVEEVPSAVKAIAGVGTSTAGFIGTVPSTRIPLDPVTNERVGTGDGSKTTFRLARTPVDTATAKVQVNNNVRSTGAAVTNESGFSQVKFDIAPAKDDVITVSYTPVFAPVAPGEVKLCTN